MQFSPFQGEVRSCLLTATELLHKHRLKNVLNSEVHKSGTRIRLSQRDQHAVQLVSNLRLSSVSHGTGEMMEMQNLSLFRSEAGNVAVFREKNLR